MLSSTPASRGRRRRPALTQQLDRDWDRLRVRPSTRQQVAAWGTSEPILASYADLDSVLAATKGPSSPDPDQVLAAVVRRAADDELATHVVLRRLLPGLVRIAIRRGGTGQWQVKSLFDDLAAAGWVVVRTYPLERRPRRVAANLLLDAEYEVCVRPFRRRAASEVLVPSFASDSLQPRLLADATGRHLAAPHHPSDELAALLVECRDQGLPRDDVDLLWSLYLDAEPVQAAAGRLSVSPRTVLSRRLAATARLRAVA